MVFPEWHFNRNLQIQFNKEIKGYCKDEADSFSFLKVWRVPLITHLHTYAQFFSSLSVAALPSFPHLCTEGGSQPTRHQEGILFILPVNKAWGSSSASSLLSEISRPPIAELWSFFQAYAPRIYSNPSNSLKNGSVFKDKLAGTESDRLWNLVVIHTLRKDHSLAFSSAFHPIVSLAVI